MQLADEIDYHQRSLYSWARVYANQLSSGHEYENLKKTIAIHILNFTFIDYKEEKGWANEYINKYHHCFTLQDRETKVELFPDLEIHTIELNKFQGLKDESLDKILPKVKDMLDTWVALLTRYTLLDANKLPMQIDLPEIKKALNIMQEMKFNEQERDIYNAHLDFLRIEASAFKKKFLEGMEKGMEKGIEKGKLEVARQLLAEGMEPKMIARITGLSEEIIKKSVMES